MKTLVFLITFLTALSVISCSKKHHPGKTSTEKNESSAKHSDSLTKKVVKPKPKTAIPKIIVVNDSVARKSIDGRLYYDLLGGRYWKNYKDGKYYLFNKSMYTNPAFKKPG